MNLTVCMGVGLCINMDLWYRVHGHFRWQTVGLQGWVPMGPNLQTSNRCQSSARTPKEVLNSSCPKPCARAAVMCCLRLAASAGDDLQHPRGWRGLNLLATSENHSNHEVIISANGFNGSKTFHDP